MATEQDVLALVDEFVCRVASLVKPERFSYSLSELRPEGRFYGVKELRCAENWKGWCDRSGVYYIVRGTGTVAYIGKASPGPLGPEVRTQTNPAEGAWGEVVCDVNARVGIVAFDDSDWFWVLALEAFLIDKVKRPQFNYRIG